MVGNEGMAGMPFILGIGVSGVGLLCKAAVGHWRMAAVPFRVEFDRNQALQEALYRYMYGLMAQISQTAACNRFHEAEPRLARWLLMTRDRVKSDQFPLTHEFLAHMLGTRREGVTAAASALKRRSLIEYRRGELRDRPEGPGPLWSALSSHPGRLQARAVSGRSCRLTDRPACRELGPRSRAQG